MPEWIIWAAFIWLFFGVMGRGRCAWGGGTYHGKRPLERSRARRPRPLPGPRGSAGRQIESGSGAAASEPAPRRKETPEERARRRFVDGVTTLDEYEAELWEVLGPKRSG